MPARSSRLSSFRPGGDSGRRGERERGHEKRRPVSRVPEIVRVNPTTGAALEVVRDSASVLLARAVLMGELASVAERVDVAMSTPIVKGREGGVSDPGRLATPISERGDGMHDLGAIDYFQQLSGPSHMGRAGRGVRRSRNSHS